MILFVFLHFWASKAAPVLVVDLGNDWIKGSVVDLENPNALAVVDIIIDEQSERKQPACVGFESVDELVFGHSAGALFYRTGKTAIPSLLRLLGGDQEVLESWQSDFSSHFNPIHTEQGIVFPNVVPQAPAADADVSVNSGIALLLAYFRRLGDDHLKQTGMFKNAIEHAVLLVPSYFSEGQRSLYSQLASVAGLKVVRITSS